MALKNTIGHSNVTVHFFFFVLENTMRLIAVLALLGLLNSVVGLVKYQPEAVHIAYGGMYNYVFRFIL